MFSVVIPLYNKEAYIGDAVNSVLNQTYGDFELIVVDDGSTDASLSIVRSYTDPRIKVCAKENGGVSSARNYGISKARSGYIGFLDADDKWEPGFLEEMKRLIDEYPQCGMYASSFRKLRKYKTFVCGEEIAEGIVANFFQVKLESRIPCSSAVVVRKEAFDEVGGFPVGMVAGEDDYTWAKVALKYQVAFSPKVLVLVNDIGSSSALRVGRMDSCKEWWFDLYKKGDFHRNEFVARKAIYAGIRYAYNKENQNKSKEIERLTRYNVLSKSLWRELYFLNRVPLRVVLIYEDLLSACKKVKNETARFIRNRRRVIQQTSWTRG